ncbi:MAG: M15 family metallopeptidase [Agarilytica sp.]
MNVGKVNPKIDLDAVCLGKDSSCIDFSTIEKPIHRALIKEIAALKQSAKKAGFDLRLASGYRSFERQLKIWNEKANGLRPVLDKNEVPLDVKHLTKKELMFAILRWSALPGASRHHWGTDFDIYDASSIDDAYPLQLTVSETINDGPFVRFYRWLAEELKNNQTFFRPYENDLGGVAPEPWHLSCRGAAIIFQTHFTVELLRKNIEKSDMALKSEVLVHLDEVFERFIKVNKD